MLGLGLGVGAAQPRIPGSAGGGSSGSGAGISIAHLATVTQYDAAEDEGLVSPTPITGLTLEADDDLVVAVAHRGGSVELGVGGINYNGYGMSRLTTRGFSAGYLEVFSIRPGAGSGTVTLDNLALTGDFASVAMAFRLRGAAPIDVSAVANGTSTSPSSGNASATNHAIELLLGLVATAGPPTDAAGTWSNGFLAGQRAGVTGPTYPVTLSQAHRCVTESGVYAAAKSGITSRAWAAHLLAFRQA